jgi:NTE family protein
MPPYPPRPESYDKAVGLCLQGGGALGSYQAGAYEAIAQSEYLPDWVAGISIGAINAALIAGNPPERRVERLRTFWERVTVPTGTLPLLAQFETRKVAEMAAALFGQTGFFAPRSPLEWFGRAAPVSPYSLDPLRETLAELVDFDLINSRAVRLAVGAVEIATGNLIYFDNHERRIGPEHIMASGALPPGFPPVEVEGALYWDGGLVSNTPLEYMIDSQPRRSRLAFEVDLFSARGEVPTTLDEATERQLDIRYASRTRAGATKVRETWDLRHLANAVYEMLPDAARSTPEARRLYHFGCVTTMDVAHLIYRPERPQGAAKDYEFSRRTMLQRWDEGRADADATLRASPWLAPMPDGLGARAFDVQRPAGG